MLTIYGEIYDENVLENDLDALLSRIIYALIRGPSSMYAI